MKTVRSLIHKYCATFFVIALLLLGGIVAPTYTYAQNAVVTGAAAFGGAFAGSLAAKAVSGLGGSTASDAECNPVNLQCGCNLVPNSQGQCVAGANMHGCFCSQTQNGISVGGVCDAPMHCKASSVGGVSGGSGSGVSSLGQLAQALGQVLGQLMSQSSSGSSGSSGSTGSAGCMSSYYYTSNSSIIGIDPCAIYQAPSTVTTATTTEDNGCTLESELDGTCDNSGTTTSTVITNTNTNTNTNSPIAANVTGVFTASSTTATPPPSGISGSIEQTGTGATFVANAVATGTETSLFFGGDTVVGFVDNLIGGWCEARPWASGFIASIIPPSFFDGLCSTNGFQVGEPTPVANTQSNVVLTQTPVEQSFTQPAPVVQVIASSTTVIPSRVDIWAVPTSVPLGSRTTIFWNTENVTNCSETSPDGSFSETSLTGGAATVPLTQPTTYTISCLDYQNNPATAYVTVGISD